MDKQKLKALLMTAQSERWPENRMDALADQLIKGSTDEVAADKLPPPADSSSPHFPSYLEQAAHAPDPSKNKNFKETTHALEAQPQTRVDTVPKGQHAEPGAPGTYPKGGPLTPQGDTRETDRDGRPTNPERDLPRFRDVYPKGQEPKRNDEVRAPDPRQPVTPRGNEPGAAKQEGPLDKQDKKAAAQPVNVEQPNIVDPTAKTLKKADKEDHKQKGSETPSIAKAAHPFGQDMPPAKPMPKAGDEKKPDAEASDRFHKVAPKAETTGDGGSGSTSAGMGSPSASGSPAK